MTRRTVWIIHHPVHQPGTEESAPRIQEIPSLSIGNRILIAACAILALYIIGTAGVALWKMW